MTVALSAGVVGDDGNNYRASSRPQRRRHAPIDASPPLFILHRSIHLCVDKSSTWPPVRCLLT